MPVAEGRRVTAGLREPRAARGLWSGGDRVWHREEYARDRSLIRDCFVFLHPACK